MKAQWIDRLGPRAKQYLVIGGAVIGVGVLIAVLDPGPPERKESGENVIKSVLTTSSTRELGLDALAAAIKDLESGQKAIRDELERGNKSRRDQGGDVGEEIKRLRADLERERAERLAAMAQLEDAAKGADADQPASNPGAGGAAFDPSDPAALFGAPPPARQVRDTAPDGAPGQPVERAAGPKIVTIAAPAPKGAAEKDERIVQHLPSGSILTGVIIAGLDAPTGQAARRDPFPALLRLKHDALLPNRFRQDVRECFLTASGYGDLASERAYLRAENISCVTANGEIIDQRIQAFATGEDGKAGIRGRLVSRQGQLIARSLMAGFMSGVAEMFDVDPVPTINVNRDGRGSGTQEYQRVLTGDAFRGAAVKGAGRALERIADFYLDMAENMYPVIEVDAGRRVDFIVQKGVPLDGKG